MCIILVNRFEDWACPVNVWLGKLTVLDMTPLGWLGRKTSTQTNKITLGPDATPNTELHKTLIRIKAPNSVNASKRKYKNQINHYDKQRRALMANPTVCQSKWKPVAEPRRAKPKAHRQAPTYWLKFIQGWVGAGCVRSILLVPNLTTGSKFCENTNWQLDSHRGPLNKSVKHRRKRNCKVFEKTSLSKPDVVWSGA